MLVSEHEANRVWLVKHNSLELQLVAGSGQWGSRVNAGNPAATQLFPTGVAFGPVDATAYIADSHNHRILKVALDCNVADA
jgi:sugar lactone lactonase YvrE